jgi:methionyl-tRNA formyltransferase
MSELKVMILCGRAPRHLFVANRLCEAARVVAVVQEIGTAWSAAKLSKLLRVRTSANKAWRWLRDRRRYTGDAEAAFFFPGGEPRFASPTLVHQVPTVNDPSVVELARKLQPDLIAVFGTSLIRGPLLSLGRLGLLNLHGGLSPNYRGADCTFWALYHGEPHQVGCTIHFIDAGIDTGKLVAHVCPAVKSGDDELTLFWRAVRDAADVYAEAIRRLGKGEALGLRQIEKGRLYQVRQRGLRHEIALARSLRRGLLGRVNLAPRVRWFTSAPAKPVREAKQKVTADT